MTRLKVHHMAEGGTPQATIAAKCGISVRTVERVLAEAEPTREEIAVNSRQGAKRPGRPAVTSDALIERIRTLLGEETIAATEVLRRARGWGFTGSRSTMAALVKELRPTPRKEAIIRFEGLPGEYTQFDFGEANVQYADGCRDKLVFWAARMKYSRMMHVIVVVSPHLSGGPPSGGVRYVPPDVPAFSDPVPFGLPHRRGERVRRGGVPPCTRQVSAWPRASCRRCRPQPAGAPR